MPLQESGLILSGPDDSIFDDIFDWISNAISSITSSVTGWVSHVWIRITDTIFSRANWLFASVSSWWQSIVAHITSGWGYITSWVTTSVGQVWSWINTGVLSITSNLGAWFSEQWAKISGLFSGWFATVSELFSGWFATIGGWFTAFSTELEARFTWLGSYLEEKVVTPMTAWWDQFLENLFTPSKWLSGLMDALTGWFTEDIPGHSPRWMGIFDSIGEWFTTWLVKFPQYMAEGFPEKVAYGLTTSLKWVGDTFNSVFESFNDAIIGFARQIGPMSPGNAANSYSSMAKIGMAALGGLAGMTIAGEFLNPLSHLGLGHISAMIYDMTNYKLITGAFMGAITATMLRTPLTYYFNDLFRPWLLDRRDFIELMSRDAFSSPEKLQEPALTSAIRTLAPGGGAAFEQSLIGYYGYPGAYHGLFKELSHTRLGYFALAGVARSGFYERKWFVEALSRTGYSATARDALLRMYETQVKDTRQGMVMGQLRRQLREGYTTMGEARATLDEVTGMEDLDDIRMLSMELEQETTLKDMAVDIHLSSFTRGITSEAECRKNLGRIIISGDIIDLQLLRTKLGLMRRLSVAVEAPVVAPIQMVEE